MASYNIKLVSKTNAGVLIVGLLAVFFCGILIFIPHGVHNTGMSMMITAVCLIVVYFLWQRFATERTEWTVDEKEVNITWIRKFPFTVGEEIVFTWDEVKMISRGSDRQYYNLKVELITGQTIKFYHDTLTTGDDFEECLKTMHQIFSQKNS